MSVRDFQLYLTSLHIKENMAPVMLQITEVENTDRARY